MSTWCQLRGAEPYCDFHKIVPIPSSTPKPTSRLQFFTEYVSGTNMFGTKLAGKNTFFFLIFRLTAFEIAKHNQFIRPVSKYVV
jgi:hypothetical protein